jgi:hypothetical protein
MPRITQGGGVSNMVEDREQARQNLAAQGVTDPSADQINDALQDLVSRRDASAHLQQGAGEVTPERQAAKAAGVDPDADQDDTDDTDDQADDDESGGEEDAFDPGDYTVEDVNQYLADLDDDDAGNAERERVLEAERRGKARVTILGA